MVSLALARPVFAQFIFEVKKGKAGQRKAGRGVLAPRRGPILRTCELQYTVYLESSYYGKSGRRAQTTLIVLTYN